MLNRFLVIAPYNVEILRAMANATIAKIAEFTIIGAKNRVIEISYLHSINYKKFVIHDIQHDLDMCFKANELLSQEKFDGIIIGYLAQSYHKNITKPEYEINIIDIPQMRHLIFICTKINEEFIGYEEKKDAIIVAKHFMQELNVSYFHIGLVSGVKTKTQDVEKNVISSALDNDVIDVITVKDIFESYYNLLVFSDYNATRLFIDTILLNDKCKYASVKKASKHYVIDAKNLNSKNIFFSIFLIHKICLDSEAS